MKNILLLSTGGTIASAPTENGLAPAIHSDNILSLLDSVLYNYKVTTKDILSLDSSNIQPEEWKVIAKSIYENCNKYDGIVITHGTDTMAYTASILSFMLPNIQIPVVITGSQLPLLNPLTDGIENLRCAFAMAASETPGIFLAFNRKVILGSRAVKVRTTGFDAFESVNSPYAATIDSSGLHINHQVIKKVTGKCKLEDKLCKDIFLIKLTPGLNPEIFDMLLNMNYKGIVIEAFGAGGLHFIRRDLISKLEKIVQKGITVVVCSQCLYERSDFSIYETGKLALEKGVLQGYDMTTEATVTKLMWALGKTNDVEEIKKIFQTSFVGEVTIL
ncbi:asparaginase [Clostridium saccharobutylicum]|uniref:asparaginase n=1 Tax=Clostridium saccharobutylicum DSM 13864 TaxID=1345695 RepID=U5MT36_CLOSA|nr:asparaginase [Clostridium saccharobutylicum]AGX43760.1 L-asparaginase 1 [Clostridium saccharobutylicum DSM 13864]AQR91058.1 L-asparaginase 1 [Clostridium saccharobutylicum]AQS00962.1 L-asparaginase 1 [Clostridium saccharobutylicum]AQS10700.1 L-asparaginase 1 [Clostridium saccharobutylicum]AQS14945.1 L-asparaginase 1 [Clostridium saccharobutylicum]